MNITIISSNILYVTHQMSLKKKKDPVGGTVRYKMMNYKVIPVGIGGTGSVYGNIQPIWKLFRLSGNVQDHPENI